MLQLALTKAGSAMGNLGNSWEQTIGLVTAGTEIMVGQPSKVGRGLRTIGINLANMAKKTDTWTAANGKLSVSLKDQNGDVRSTYDIMADVAGQWDNLSNSEKNAIATTAAGKNQYEVFTSIMKNFKSAQDATQTAINSNGSAMKENAKYMDSIEGKVAALKSAWSRFSNEMLNSDEIKGVLTGLTKVVDFLASDVGQATIKLAAFSAMGFGLVKMGKKAIGTITTLSGAFKLLRGADINKISDASVDMALGFEKSAKGAKTMLGAFTSSTAFALALPATIALASVALAKYVDIGASKKAKQSEENFKKTSEELDKLNSKLKQNNGEIERLENKKGNGGLTDQEEARLSVLKQQTAEYEAQIRAKKALKLQDANEKWTSPDPSKLKGSQKEKYTNAKAAGKSDKEALAAAGVYTKADVAIGKYTDTMQKAQDVAKRYQDAIKNVNDKTEKYGATSKEATKAGEHLKEVEKEASKVLGKDNVDATQATNKQLAKLKDSYSELMSNYGAKNLNDLLGMKDVPDTVKRSAKQMNSLIKASDGLQKIRTNAKGASKDFAKMGEGIVTLSRDGKKIANLDVGKFTSSLKSAGASTDEISDALKEIHKANPKVKFTGEGAEKVKKDLGIIEEKADKKETKKVSVKADTKKANKNLDATKLKANSIPRSRNVKISASSKGAIGVIGSVASALAKLPKTKTVTVKTKKQSEAHGTRNFQMFARGTGNAQVNEQGFEIIQDGRTGDMRIANGGYRGLTWINNGDAVYTHGQSMRMLAKAGLTERGLLQGADKDKDLSVFGVSKLEGFKKGKKSSKASKQKAYSNARDKLRDTYDDAISKAQYQQERYHYSDEWLTQQMTKARNTYLKNLKALNKKYSSSISKSTTLSTDQERDYQLALSDLAHDKATKDIDAQKEELAYGRKTYKQLADLYKKYLNDKKISAEEYADYIKELNEAEVDRVRDNYSNQWDYVSKYIQRQIDLEEKDNELLEAKANLLQVQTQKVKVYREGQGFVYEADAQAIKEAQEDLKSYTSVWQQLQDYMDEVQSQTELHSAEVLAGSNLADIIKGGLNIDSWKSLINLIGADKGAYDLAEDLGITDKSNINASGQYNNINIADITLPNVSNATDFMSELNLIATQAIQVASVRS